MSREKQVDAAGRLPESREKQVDAAAYKLPDRFVSREEAAAFLGLATATLAQWASDGHGPPFVKFSSGRCAPTRYSLLGLQQFVADPQSRKPRPKATFHKPAPQGDAQPRLNVMRARTRRGKPRGKV
jgi:hypothetical protein